MEFTNSLYMLIGFILCLGLMLLIMPPMINYLHKIKFDQTEREEGLESHKKKNGTPTMGGLIFLLPMALTSVIFNIGGERSGIVAMSVTLSYGAVGLLDDFLTGRILMPEDKVQLLLRCVEDYKKYVKENDCNR